MRTYQRRYEIGHEGQTHATIPPEQFARLGIGDALVRLSVGIEDVADLRADLEYALGRIVVG